MRLARGRDAASAQAFGVAGDGSAAICARLDRVRNFPMEEGVRLASGKIDFIKTTELLPEMLRREYP